MCAKIRVSVLASDSLGVRSMCTLVETPDISIVCDGGVSLGMRYGLLPHPLEYRRLKESITKMNEAFERAQVVTVSHYHFDHYRPPFVSDFVWTWSSKEEVGRIYKDKILLCKDIRENINPSQKMRGWFFLKEVRKIASKLEVADGKAFQYGSTTIRFSSPLPHGETGSKLGYVLALTVSYDEERVVFAPDVQGPGCPESTGYILSERPDVLVIGGPPTYLSPSLIDARALSSSINELAKLASELRLLVVDHHLMRDALWREKISIPIMEARRKGHVLISAASYMHKTEELLESQRRILYEKNPPGNEFIKWTKMSPNRRRATPPPI
jgi:predicted metallo-beta-lactamase superfamily hydrolase